MKHKALTVISVILVLVGLTLLIAPKISNHVGEQIAHTTIEDFKALKSKATSDEPTEKNDSSENSISNSNPAADPAKSENDPLWQIEDEEGNNEDDELSDSVRNVDFDRLYSDSICLVISGRHFRRHGHGSDGILQRQSCGIAKRQAQRGFQSPQGHRHTERVR